MSFNCYRFKNSNNVFHLCTCDIQESGVLNYKIFFCFISFRNVYILLKTFSAITLPTPIFIPHLNHRLLIDMH
jgi:hypothetical protein